VGVVINDVYARVIASKNKIKFEARAGSSIFCALCLHAPHTQGVGLGGGGWTRSFPQTENLLRGLYSDKSMIMLVL
jgi:hypothetical protein